MIHDMLILSVDSKKYLTLLPHASILIFILFTANSCVHFVSLAFMRDVAPLLVLVHQREHRHVAETSHLIVSGTPGAHGAAVLRNNVE